MPTPEQRAQVEVMVGCGLTHKQIASVIFNPQTGRGISDKTLARHFAYELECGKAKVHAKVGLSIVQKACGNGPQAVTAAIWYSKTQMGWREKVDVEHTGGVLVVPVEVTPEQWIAEQQEKAKHIPHPSERGGADPKLN